MKCEQIHDMSLPGLDEKSQCMMPQPLSDPALDRDGRVLLRLEQTGSVSHLMECCCSDYSGLCPVVWNHWNCGVVATAYPSIRWLMHSSWFVVKIKWNYRGSSWFSALYSHWLMKVGPIIIIVQWLNVRTKIIISKHLIYSPFTSSANVYWASTVYKTLCWEPNT